MTARELARELLKSMRSGYLFGNRDEPIDDAGKRLLRVIVQRIEGDVDFNPDCPTCCDEQDAQA